MKQVVILAGGQGTRLAERFGSLPKALVPIGGKPLIEHQLELACGHGFADVRVFVHHQAAQLQQHLGDGRRWGARVICVVEPTPLGTAGALLAALDQLADRFIVFYGDTMVNVDLARLWAAHQGSGADATLVLHPNNHPLDSDLVEVDAAGRITAFHHRPHPAGCWFQNLVNAGLYVLNRRALAQARAALPALDQGRLLDFGKDLFPVMLARGAQLQGYQTPEFIKDIGTPARYDSVAEQYARGIVHRSTLATSQSAVFLDRDGTLVKEVSPLGLSAPEQLELLPGAAAAIRRLNEAGLRAVVVTNQPVVAKGLVTEAGLRVIHNRLETLLGREQAFLDRLYFCPHHPQKGFPGERLDLKIDCTCRQPALGLIQRAARELNLDLTRSWLVGDTTTDLQTARNAGVRPILVRTGYGGRDGRHAAVPEVTCDDLSAAVRVILEPTPP